MTKAYEVEKMAHCDTLKEKDKYVKKYLDRKKKMKKMKGSANIKEKQGEVDQE